MSSNIKKEGTSNYKVPEYLKWMNEEEKLENQKIIKNMNKRIDYKRNPRYNVDKEALTFKSLIHRQSELTQEKVILETSDSKNTFKASPQQVVFTHYLVNNYYQQNLVLTNSTNISQRLKILPPSSPQYSIDSVTYPLNKTLVAPGMSVIIVINFKATSMAEFQDQIGIITEETSFYVTILSKKEAPQIHMASNLDCGSCWYGDKTSNTFKIKNTGGAAGFKLFNQKEDYHKNYLDNDQEGSDCLKLNNFTIYPSEFYMEKGQVQLLQVDFNPKAEGLTTEKMVMAADNETNCEYSLSGTANLAEFQIASLDDQSFVKPEIDNFYNQKNVLENLRTIRFECTPGQTLNREVRIKNMSGVKVKYRWLLFWLPKEDQDYLHKQDNQQSSNHPQYFSITPQEGYFEGLQTMHFQITYDRGITNLSTACLEYVQWANLVVEDIPIKSIQQPSKGLQQQHGLSQQHEEEDNIITNCKMPSISVYEFQLTGVNKTSEVRCEPSFALQRDVLVSSPTKESFSLVNHNTVPTSYTVKVVQQQQPNNLIQIIDIQNGQGVVGPNSTQLVSLLFRSHQVATNQKLELEVVLQNQEPIYFSLVADFRDSRVRIEEDMVDFDLVQAGLKGECTLTLHNEDNKDTILFFTSQDVEDSIGQQVLTLLQQDLNQVPPIKLGQQQNLLLFSQQIVRLAPQETIKIKVSYQSSQRETLQSYIKMFTHKRPSQTLFVFAEVQDIHVTLNRFQLDFDCLYAGNIYKINRHSSQQVQLVNQGNIPTQFKWLSEDSEDLSILFSPSEGVLGPKQTLLIEVDLRVNQGGSFSYIMVCQVDGLEFPLGIQIHTLVKGLQVALHHTLDESGTNLGIPTNKTLSLPADIPNSKSRKSKTTKRTNNNPEITLNQEMEYPLLNSLVFAKCQINKPQQVKIIIKNLSGIDSSFRVAFGEYQVSEELVKRLDLESQQQKDQQSNKYTLRMEKQCRFTSKGGQELDQQRKLQKDSKYYLQMNKGVALVSEPQQGVLKGYSQQEIVVTCFNDICGTFKDNMTLHVKGLPDLTFPADVVVRGSPIKIARNQLGLEFGNNLYPKVKFGVSVNDCSSKEKLIRVENSGPKQVVIDWRVLRVSNDQKGPYFKFKIESNHLGTPSQPKYKVKWESIEPNQEGLKKIFSVEPQRKVMKGRSEYQFKFCYQSSHDTGHFGAVAVASTSIQDSSLELEKLVVKMQAQTKEPQLLLEKNQNLISLSKKVGQAAIVKVQTLHNQMGCNLELGLGIEGPFELMSHRTDSNLSASSADLINVEDKCSLQLELKYLPTPQDITDSLLVTRHYSSGVLTCLFSNGQKQNIPLEGLLLRPAINLFTQGFQNFEESLLKDDKSIVSLDFHTIYVNNKKTLSIHISSLTEVAANVRIAHVKKKTQIVNANVQTITRLEKEEFSTTDDPSVFEFSLSQFVLEQSSILLNKMPNGLALPSTLTNIDNQQKGLLPQEIKVNFRPKQNIEYKSRFRLVLKDGNPIDFYLKGSGTYKEEIENKV